MDPAKTSPKLFLNALIYRLIGKLDDRVYIAKSELEKLIRHGYYEGVKSVRSRHYQDGYAAGKEDGHKITLNRHEKTLRKAEPNELEELINSICDIAQVRYLDLIKQNKGDTNLAAARSCVMFIARRDTLLSQREIGECFGGRLANTVSKSVRAMNRKPSVRALEILKQYDERNA